MNRNCQSCVSAKVKSRLPNHRFVIVLHSPSGLSETGLLVCGPGKMATKPAWRNQRDTFSSPVSGRKSQNCGDFERFFGGM